MLCKSSPTDGCCQLSWCDSVRGLFHPITTIGAEDITEFILLAAEVCICNGNYLKFKKNSVSVNMDFFPNSEESVSEMDSYSNSGKGLCLQLELHCSQNRSVLINLDQEVFSALAKLANSKFPIAKVGGVMFVCFVGIWKFFWMSVFWP